MAIPSTRSYAHHAIVRRGHFARGVAQRDSIFQRSQRDVDAKRLARAKVARTRSPTTYSRLDSTLVGGGGSHGALLREESVLVDGAGWTAERNEEDARLYPRFSLMRSGTLLLSMPLYSLSPATLPLAGRSREKRAPFSRGALGLPNAPSVALSRWGRGGNPPREEESEDYDGWFSINSSREFRFSLPVAPARIYSGWGNGRGRLLRREREREFSRGGCVGSYETRDTLKSFAQGKRKKDSSSTESLIRRSRFAVAQRFSRRLERKVRARRTRRYCARVFRSNPFILHGDGGLSGTSVRTFTHAPADECERATRV